MGNRNKSSQNGVEFNKILFEDPEFGGNNLFG